MIRLRMVFSACLLLAACSGAQKAAPEKGKALIPELEAPARDLEFEKSEATLAAGPVDKYVPLRWINNARAALDSDGDPRDLRGDFPAALRWSGLAARAVLNRPDSNLVFEILTEHMRICNHVSRPGEAAASLRRLRSFKKLDRIRRALVNSLALQAELVPTRLADGTYSTRYWSYAHPDMASRVETFSQQLAGLLAPNQADKELQDAWLRLRTGWTAVVCALAAGTATSWSRAPDDDWRNALPFVEKSVLRSIWYVPSERYPKVVSILHLQLVKFYEAVGDKEKALQNLQTAKRMVLPTKDPTAMLRVQLAEIDRILAPSASVEMLGIAVGGPNATDAALDPPPDIRPPAPESVWLTRTAQVEARLVAAESSYRKEHNLRGLAATWLRRGLVATGMGRYDEAAEFYRQSESVSLLAGDTGAGIIAVAHLLAVELRADQIGRAQQAEKRFFAMVDESGQHALALSMGDALLGIAGREFTRFGTPNQRLAVLRFSAQCYERYAPPALLLRHYGNLLRLAAHFRYHEEVRSYAGRALGVADSLLAGKSTPPMAENLRGQVKAGRCDLVHTAAAALVAGTTCGEQCLLLAEEARHCTKELGAAATMDTEEVQLTLALARASNGQAIGARELLAEDDLVSHLEVALRGGQTDQVVKLSRQFVATSRALLADVLPSETDPETAVDPDAPEEVATPVDQALLATARANLAADVRRLSQALVAQGVERVRADGSAKPPEFIEARALLDEWRELTVASGEWKQRPWELLSLYGQIAASLGEKPAAWISFSGALAAIWQKRDTIGSLWGKAAFTASVATMVEQAMGFLLQYGEEEFDMPQHGRMSGAAGALLLREDLEAQSLAATLDGGTPFHARLLAGQDALSLRALEQRLRRSRSEEDYIVHTGGAAEIAAARTERETVESWLEQSRNDLATKYPRLAIARGVPRPFSPEDLRKLADSRGVTFLVYRLSHPTSAAWVVSAEKIRSVRIDASEMDIGRLAKALRNGLATRSDTSTASSKLHDLLLAPVMALLPTTGTVAIVPDGILHRLPFAVLEKNGTSLLTNHPFFVVPSLPLYAHLAKTDGPPRKEPQGVFLTDTTAAPGDPTGVAATLEEALGDEDFLKSFYGTGASETAFYSASRTGDIIHLAAPVRPFATEPMYSGLLLATAAEGDDDGLLQAWEIAANPLTAKLAVVDARGAGPGAWSEEEATGGLARGFFTAGIPAFVTNSNLVDQAASDFFFEQFYSALQGGSTVCEATRKATLATRKQPALSHPAMWGMFTSYGLGDTRVMDQE
jgi:CHAT domain-containing protein/tetratricopeptide (TPR) repeat protein